MSERVFDQDGLWSVADHRPDGKLLLAKELGSAVTENPRVEPRDADPQAHHRAGRTRGVTAVYGADGRDPGPHAEARRVPAALPLAGGKLDARHARDQARRLQLRHRHGRTRILYTVNEDGYTRLHGARRAHLQAAPAAEASRGRPRRARRHRRATARYTTLQRRLRDARRSQATCSTGRRAKLDAVALPSAPEVDTTTFAPRDARGLSRRATARTIPMFVRRPPELRREAVPGIVEFHGGPEGRRRPGFSLRAQLFVDAGFIFVEPNVRGSDGYGKTWFHADDGPKRLDVITDIEDAAKYIRARLGRRTARRRRSASPAAATAATRR